MKNVLIVILCLIMFGFTTYKSDFKSALYLIEGNSKLGITGTTNVNTFSCDLVFSDINSKINTQYQKEGDKIKFQNAHIELSNSCFDCGSRMMNSDFLEMLNTKNYPYITLDLKEISINPKNKGEIIALVNISMAGRSKFYSIWLNVDDSKSLKVVGCLNLKLSDFNHF